MIKLTQTGPGSVSTPIAVRDSRGKGILPIQVKVTPGAEWFMLYRIMGRVSPDAPWHELRPWDSEDYYGIMARVPYLQLEVYRGEATATMWIGEE